MQHARVLAVTILLLVFVNIAASSDPTSTEKPSTWRTIYNALKNFLRKAISKEEKEEVTESSYRDWHNPEHKTWEEHGRRMKPRNGDFEGYEDYIEDNYHDGGALEGEDSLKGLEDNEVGNDLKSSYENDYEEKD